MLYYKVSNVVRAIGGEAEAHQALSKVIDQFVLLEKGSELLQNLREGWCAIHLLLFAAKPVLAVAREISVLVAVYTRAWARLTCVMPVKVVQKDVSWGLHVGRTKLRNSSTTFC